MPESSESIARPGNAIEPPAGNARDAALTITPLAVDHRTLNISPHVYVLIAVTVALASFGLFRVYGHVDTLFFAPILALAFAWGLANYVRQGRGYSIFSGDATLGLSTLLRKSALRFIVWLVVIYTALQIFTLHLHYRDNTSTRAFLDFLFDLYLYAGLPYFLVTLRFKASRLEDYYDPAIRIVHVLRYAVLRLLRLRRRSRFHPLSKKYNRKVLFNLVMRAYFIPVMMVQLPTTMSSALFYADHGFQNHNPLAVLFWLTSILWFVDSLSAATAYGIESRWMENRTRSIDLTTSGWVICLCCYPPINNVTNTLFPFGPNIAGASPDTLLLQAPAWLWTIKIVETTLLAMLVYSDLSLGPSGANITFKRLQSRGPYGIVRHPATVCKLSFWWLQSACYGGFWTLPWVAGQLGWSTIYILRALTEERHLSHFPEYRAYKDRVRYRFIPGVV